jgi:5-methylcytosine-specific restriction endonuclease McrA
MKRHTCKLQATPSWADLDGIEDVYLEAEYMQMEVDHIVPLQSNLVCGLHVWDNLQLLTKSENCQKKNHYWPDMPTTAPVSGDTFVVS